VQRMADVRAAKCMEHLPALGGMAACMALPVPAHLQGVPPLHASYMKLAAASIGLCALTCKVASELFCDACASKRRS